MQAYVVIFAAGVAAHYHQRGRSEYVYPFGASSITAALAGRKKHFSFAALFILSSYTEARVKLEESVGATADIEAKL
ncbi:hypothetical protein PC114_g18511 [Phytophthora cactorum]|nr:hypothetical protein PC114_g18511 [Phytophthora cactorum]KAG3196892.1 hypothetical protein PC128_g7294 [Phytophthora cactorum]KAG4047017.1 hypothetical protein PC123_g17617 [Phytophthora cactorum]